MTSLPTVSVIIAAWDSGRFERLREAVNSVRQQSVRPAETIVVIDHNPGLLARAREELSATVMASAGRPGASGTRNTGAAASSGEILAFLDDDARASRIWLAALLPHFADKDVAGVGGQVMALWETSRPRWFPPEFDWAVGASYRGMPDAPALVRNVWSNNMAIRRSAFEAAGGFREDFGKTGARSRPEDTDLCLRAEGTWIYEPAGLAGHWVPAERATLRYFIRRCFHEGLGKAELSALDGRQVSTAAERAYTAQVLPRAMARGLGEAARGDLSGVVRSVAVAAGFGVTAAGFAAGLVRGRRAGAR